MKTYEIYHPIDGEMNPLASKKSFTYKKVGNIEVPRDDYFYPYAQNMSLAYAQLDVRSTCVGDIVVYPDGKTVMIEFMGVSEVEDENLLSN
jgi:hypothetical protein